MPSFTPEVNPKAEFAEIANDFSNPLEIIREAISNCFDAKASEIKISVFVDKTSGVDELVVEIKDDGDGVSEVSLKNFFGLGFSTRLKFDELGNKISDSIGEKGHGTKIYFNSRNVELTSIKDKKKIHAFLENPIQTLRSKNNRMPEVKYEITDSTENNGTIIKISGYNLNSQSGFSHNEIKDYIYWFTKYGSFENQIRKISYTPKLFLKGLGANDFEILEYGHPFPNENSNINDLKKIDKVSPLDHFVAKWVFPNEQVKDFPDVFIDMIFYIEGDKAKRIYNKMIHEKNASWAGGVYNVETRYGLWLCKDFIPIERHNDWVAEKSEWTKYHAFVNCQGIKLTANRGDAGNTSSKLLDKISETISDIFYRKIETSENYKKYKEELDSFKQYANAKKEEDDFNRRKKHALKKKATNYMDILILEPRQEGGVFSIVTQLLTLDSNIFNFKVIDYDTSFGYDLLVTTSTALDLNQAAMYFAEMKYILKNDFNHSFKKLATIVCWDTDIPDEYELEDMTGEKRKMKITPKTHGSNGYTKYMLISNTESHNIEVFVLRNYLKEKLNLDFVPRGEIL